MFRFEFQKRGLPHVHILLHLANDDTLETAHDINNLISGEIPDPIVNRELCDIVKTCMIHGPWGILKPYSPCMKDRVCSKNYPKEFNANTVTVRNGSHAIDFVIMVRLSILKVTM